MLEQKRAKYTAQRLDDLGSKKRPRAGNDMYENIEEEYRPESIIEGYTVYC